MTRRTKGSEANQIRMTKECQSPKDEWERHRLLRHVFRASSWLLLVVALIFCGCEKKKAAVKPKVPAPVVVMPTLLTEADRLGLASRVPGDVEFCVSSVQLKKHAEALQASRWWGQMMAFVEDKAPTPDKTGSVTLDEAFLAFGKDSVKSLVLLRQLNDLYNETAYRGMMSGGVLAGLGTSFDAKKLMEAALRDPAVLEALILLLERFEMPPMMVGVASPEPEQVLKRISELLHLADWLGDAPQSRIVTAQGEKITVNEIAMDQVLTVERRRQWVEVLANAMPGITLEMKDRIARGLEVLARKKWVLALGLGTQRAYVAVGKSKDQIRLANSVEDSLLARPEMRTLDVHALKGLGLIACWDGVFWDVLQSDHPFQPIVRGLLAGLQTEKTFSGMARALEPEVVDLAAAERAFYHSEHTNGAAVAWWDCGVQMEMAGGFSLADSAALAKESQFSAALDEPELVFGMSGHGSSSGEGRAYFETWMRALHATAHELVKAGVGGEQSAAMFKLADQAVLPGVIDVYDGTKTIWQKALSGDGAFILDVGGKMPLLPGLPPGGEALPLPRFASVHEIKNRALIGVSWQNMEATLQQLLKNVPAPQPIELPKVVTKRNGDLTSYSYELPFDSRELGPCASLNDQLFMLGTSRVQQSHLAEILKQPGAGPAAGIRVKLNFEKLREFLKAFASVRAQNGGAGELKAALKWLEPFEALDLRMWSEEGVGRGRVSWRMHDVLRYD
ncbi:hypothetical protein [Prosthecobacter sp.]|uniref:hypothetical protein n=1 Tax=Prosthecobacter sp. TaxID=1965333 RepID=UPI002487ED71|nr:hypothetical protein [Prosthecobacter sp.]MDI1310709.1 hypothetical protein [Prosthecobacter sp.]